MLLQNFALSLLLGILVLLLLLLLSFQFHFLDLLLISVVLSFEVAYVNHDRVDSKGFGRRLQVLLLHVLLLFAKLGLELPRQRLRGHVAN